MGDVHPAHSRHFIGNSILSSSDQTQSMGTKWSRTGEGFKLQGIGSSRLFSVPATADLPSHQELFILSLKLLPVPWAALPLSPWALPGWWFPRDCPR